MVIEIFADNLRKSDTLNNALQVFCKLIIRSEDKAYVWHTKIDDLYFFPSGALNSKETEADCIKRLQHNYNLQNITAKKTITIKEYFPENTFINHYYVLYLTNTDELSCENEGVSSMWYDFLELLNLFDQYDGSNPHGTEIYEREFIALVNSI